MTDIQKITINMEFSFSDWKDYLTEIEDIRDKIRELGGIDSEDMTLTVESRG